MRKKKLLTSLFLIVVGFLLTVACVKVNNASSNLGPLLISEVCSHNDTIIYNDIGVYADYIELYNNSEEVIDLSNYFLSDKKEKYDLYSIPAISLEPNGYVVVFVDGTAGFALGDDESLYLSDLDGNILDIATIPKLERDKVCARNADTFQWEYNQIATPGTANIIIENEIKRIEDENSIPVLSVESGFYETPFYLELSVKGEYDIYYTLDGSEPTEDAYYYEEPILIEDVSYKENVYAMIEEISVDMELIDIPERIIDKCNIVRAVAIAPDGSLSEEVCGTYFIGYEDKYGYDDTYIISLITDPENLFSYDKGIYVSGKLADINWFGVEDKGDIDDAIANYSAEGKGWEKPVYAELYDEKGTLLQKEKMDISIHGNYSVIYAQKGFNLLISDNTDNYLFEGVLGENSTSLMLRPGGAPDYHYTQFRDALNHVLVEDRDLTVLHAVPCQVFLDGEYWGLYNLQERIDNGLIAENFNINEDDILVIKNRTVVGGDDSNYKLYSDVVEYAETHDLTEEQFYAEMEKMIDIQSYIDYYCFEIYVANCDSVSNNYSCWRTKNITSQEYCDGKWRWIIYDTDESTGILQGMTDAEVDSFSEGHLVTAPMDDPLFSALMKNETFKRRFVITFVEMADTNFAPDRVNRLIDEFADKYMEAAVASHIRYDNDEYTEEEYMEKVEVVRAFFNNRRAYIMDHLERNLGIEDVEKYMMEEM